MGSLNGDPSNCFPNGLFFSIRIMPLPSLMTMAFFWSGLSASGVMNWGKLLMVADRPLDESGSPRRPLGMKMEDRLARIFLANTEGAGGGGSGL